MMGTDVQDAMTQVRRFQWPVAVLIGLVGVLIPSLALAQQDQGQGPLKAMFSTKAEAEAAAKQFHCTGAHPMGNQWMPCASHGAASGGHGTGPSTGH
jgi:hypothetical protein